MAPPVGYWYVRCWAQPIRNLLVYKEVEFDDRRYKFGPEPEFGRKDWYKNKFSLGLRFPNFPYYIDEDVKITQSMAIIRHLARKYDLTASEDDEEERLQLDSLEQHARDLSWNLVLTVISADFDEARLKYEDNLENLLRPWDEQLQEKTCVIEDRLTYVDFLLYEALDWNHELSADAFEGFPVLTAYVERFEELPNITEHFASGNYSKYPIFGPMLKWGFEKE